MNSNEKKNKTLFILSTPYSGSTILVQLIGTSKNASIFPSESNEGQKLKEIRSFMRDKSWKVDKRIPWNHVKKVYEKNWDLSKPVLVEKSPPNLIRAVEIEKTFENAHFIVMTRNPYAWCAGIKKRIPERPFAKIAQIWIRRMKFQKYNIQNLQQVLFFTYEQLCDHPKSVVNMISKFVPELSDIDITTKLRAHSKSGIKKTSITNFNVWAISELSPNEIAEISEVLKTEKSIMEFFSYQILS